MTAIFRIESRRHLRGPLVLVTIFAILAAMYFSMFHDVREDAEELIEAFPDQMLEFFGIEAFHTIEGFIAGELYSFFWVVLIGVYFASLGGGMIAADVRSRRMDLALANPISRESVIVQKVAALLVPLLVLNVGVALVVIAGGIIIDEPLSPLAVTMVHLLSVPYFLVCAAIGLVISVRIDRVRTARFAALGLVFVLWFVDGITRLSPDFEWIGAITPSRYYDPTAILVREEYAVVDALVLLVVFIALVAIATVLFVRRDI